MNVLGILSNDKLDGSTFYRTVGPLNAMRMLGHNTGFLTKEDYLAHALKNELPEGVDLILYARVIPDPADSAWRKMLALQRVALGSATVVDFDDDFTNRYRQVTPYPMGDLSLFSAVTVSTPYLKKVMSQYSKRVTVIPNFVATDMFAKKKRFWQEPVIGLTGSVTHAMDWKIVTEPLYRIAREFPNVKFFCSGLVPNELRALPNFLTHRDMPVWAETPEGDEFFLPVEKYPMVMNEIDILLVPVDPKDKFNHSKSALKVMEGQAAGCAVIATGGDLPCYHGHVKEGKTGFLVEYSDQEAWYNKMRLLLENEQLRHTISELSYNHAIANWDLLKNVHGRVAAYQDILDRERSKQEIKKLTPIVAPILAEIAAELQNEIPVGNTEETQ